MTGNAMFNDFLTTRLHILDVDDGDTSGLLAVADFLDAEAELVAHARTDRPWQIENPDDPRLAAYLVTIYPLACDPVAARMLALADQVVAAVIRGHLPQEAR